jgi:AcrR family transcriptional regulator
MDETARERILRAALALFVERGFEATRTSDICARAAVSNGSLFHVFASKDAVAAALYRDGVAAYQAVLLAALDAEAGTKAALRAVVHAQCGWAEADQRARFLFTHGREISAGEVAREIAALNARFVAAIETWRKAPVRCSALRPMPLTAFTAVLLGPSLMAIRAWLGMGGEPPTTLAALFADAAVRSLLEDAEDA